MKKIAILGNGQLSQMLIESIKKLKIYVKSFPAPKVDIKGNMDEKEIIYYCKTLIKFNIITFEIENIDIKLLEKIIKINNSIEIHPPIQALQISQDRVNEKKLFKKLKIHTNNYISVDNLEDIFQAVKKLGYPFILKQRRLGYDGKYQFTIKNKKQVENKKIFDKLKLNNLIAEQIIDFDYEISQISSRDKYGNIVYYPITKNKHKNGILRESCVINEIDKKILYQAQEISKKLLIYFNYIGILTVEFFVKNRIVYANEIAPRVHNTGHWSIDGSKTSQFKNHMLTITGCNSKSTNKSKKYIKMINLIGEIIPNNVIFNDCTKVKLYNKVLRKNRKMGHINILSNEKEKFLLACSKIHKHIKYDIF